MRDPSCEERVARLACTHLGALIEDVLAKGNAINGACEGWCGFRTVLSMRETLDAGTRRRYLGCSDVQYWKYAVSPHGAPDEGFLCIRCSAAVVFPLGGLP